MNVSTDIRLPPPEPHPLLPKYEVIPSALSAADILAARDRFGDNWEGTFLDIVSDAEFAVWAPLIKRVIAARVLSYHEYYRPPVTQKALDRFKEGACSGTVTFLVFEDLDGRFQMHAKFECECCLDASDSTSVLCDAFDELWNDKMGMDDRYVTYQTLYEVETWLAEMQR